MKRIFELNHSKKALAALLLFALAALGQAQDWPMLQAGDTRNGQNSNASATGPGPAFLTWYTPLNSTAAGFERQVMSTEVSRTNPTDWTAYGPGQAVSEAGNLYIPVATGNTTEDQYSGYTAYEALFGPYLASGGTTQEPTDYFWDLITPSSTTSQTQALSGNTDVVTWNVEPAQTSNRIASNYALYIWIPNGPTTDLSGNLDYPAQYWTIQISYGNGQTFTDLVNTTASGSGWVRLGNGGLPTNQTFAYNGVNPIQIALYNTNPRDALGNLLDIPGTVVEADAVLAISQTGFYDASPIVSAFDPSTGNGTVHTVAAENQFLSVPNTTTPTSVTTGVVTSYVYNAGTTRWHWSPADTQSTVMTTSSAGVTVETPWASNATNVGQKGTTWLGSAADTTDSVNYQTVTYQPTLADGNYSIQAWIPGSNNGELFAQGTTYYIDEGATVSGPFVVNQDTASGWVTLGTRLYTENNAGGQPLKVVVTNYSALPSDAGRTTFTDAIQFSGQTNLAIESTPLQITVPITPTGGGTAVATAVTIVADENGRIYCLDSNGNGFGGTTLYWAYPSLASVTPDPNQVAGIDGPGPTAQMPSTFSLSSADVETIGGHPYLYIGSQNGRVYCIDMEGRGDTTTTREWSYPDDYPAVAQSSALGPITGSVAFVPSDTAYPNGTLIVPTSQGRLYALDPLGSQTTRTTFAHWEFPIGDETDTYFGAFANTVNPSGSPSDVTWTNPGNAQYVDQTYATATPDNGSGGTGNSQYLTATQGTNLTVPAGAQITGIEVSLVKHRSGGDSGLYIHDASVVLVKGGTPQTGAAFDRADTADDWTTASATLQLTGTVTSGTFTITAGALGSTSPIPYNASAAQVATALNVIPGLVVSASGNQLPNNVVTIAFDSPAFPPPTLTANSSGLIGTTPAITITPSVDQTKVYGGQTDLWGNTWASTDFSANFGVAIAVNGNGNSTTNTVLPTAGIDAVQVRIFYLAAQSLGPIVATPTVAFGDVYFGTRVKPGDSTYAYSGFFAVNQDTGVADPNWVASNGGTYGQFNGTSATATTAWNGTALNDFQSGPVAIPAAQLNSLGYITGQTDSIVVMNENQYLTSLYADGANAGQMQWTTNELGVGVKGNLAFTQMTVYNNVATQASPSQSAAPVVMVPTEDGRFDAMFALNDGNVSNGNPGSGTPTFGAKNIDWTRQAWEYHTAANALTASFATAHGFLYGADEDGYLYAFSQTQGSSSGPGGFTNTANNPGGSVYSPDFANSWCTFISASDYQAGLNGTLTYAALLADRTALYTSNTSFTIPTKDYGQSLYVAYFHFPYSAIIASGSAIRVNWQTSATGTANSGGAINAIGPLSGAPSSTITTAVLDGYALAKISFGNLTSATVGQNTLTYTISTYAIGAGGTTAAYGVTPGVYQSYLYFTIANPFVVATELTSGGIPDINHQIGWDSSGNGLPVAQDLVNGNPASVSTSGDNVVNLTAPQGLLDHGTSGTAKIYVYNRSFIPNLNTVLMQTSNLAWQYTGTPQSVIINPLPAAFQNFEDYPINSPNISLDYPDIHQANIAVVSDPSGNASNPLISYGATLKGVTSSYNPTLETPTYTPNRTLNPTEWDVTLNVPRFQPANDTRAATDSAGNALDAGYRGLMMIYAGPVTNPNAYRTFWLTAGVQADIRLFSSTPTVDLGSLSEGAGKGVSGDFSPWKNYFSGMFQPFNVSNPGNVNLVDIAVAKAVSTGGSGYTDFGINSTNGNSLDWLDAQTDAVSDIDLTYDLSNALGAGSLPAILQKARVTDASPTTLSSNPIRRTNASLGVSTGPMFTSSLAPAGAPPRISVTIPFGFPIGTYSQLLQVIENDNNTVPPNVILESGGAAVSNIYLAQPSFTLTYRVKETGLTGKLNQYVDPLIDNYLTGAETNLYASGQPGAFRDASNHLHVAFASNRGTFDPAAAPTSAQANAAPTNANMIYVASLTAGGSAGAQNPLGDLDNFLPGSSQLWFTQDVNAYPTTAATTLFLSGTSYSLDPNFTPFYGSPAFPTTTTNPLGSGNNSSPFMVFTGQALVNTGNATVVDSKVFIATATIGGAGTVSLGTPTALPDSISNPSLITGSVKQHPTVIQFGPSNATVFYTTGGAGQGQLYCATYASGWQTNQAIQFPTTFASIGSAQANARQMAAGDMLEVAFEARLVSRSENDIFFARIPCNSVGVPTQNTPVDLTQITTETLVSQKSGLYQSAGVDWDVSQPFSLAIVSSTGTVTALPAQWQVDPNSGVISENDSILGGKVILNPAAGTVQFEGATPTAGTTVTLTYTPRILRVSSGGVNALYPNVMFDTRALGGSDLNDWFTSSGGQVTSPVGAYRYLFTYGASSTGATQGARPYLSTYRLGVQLPSAILTNSTTGLPAALSVTGASSDYQVDPVNGRVYFTQADEGASVTITYTGVTSAGTALTSQSITAPVALVLETAETPVAVEGAVNEAQITSFLDPVVPSTTPTGNRPGLIWLFWTSTRNGSPDIFFETIAPNFAPTITSP